MEFPRIRPFMILDELSQSFSSESSQRHRKSLSEPKSRKYTYDPRKYPFRNKPSFKETVISSPAEESQIPPIQEGNNYQLFQKQWYLPF